MLLQPRNIAGLTFVRIRIGRQTFNGLLSQHTTKIGCNQQQPLESCSMAKSWARTILRQYSQCSKQYLPMKPGAVIPGLDIFKDGEAPVVLPHDQYPEWVYNLPTPLPSLAKLRRMP